MRDLTSQSGLASEEGAHGYFASLHLEGRDVLVVGGGKVSTRRLPALLAAGALVRVVAPAVTPRVRQWANEGALTWHEREVRPDDVQGAWYVMAAADVPDVNAMIAKEASRQRVFCVRADFARRGTASTPATASAGGVTVGVVGTRNPRRSVSLRDALLTVLADEKRVSLGSGTDEPGVPSATL